MLEAYGGQCPSCAPKAVSRGSNVVSCPEKTLMRAPFPPEAIPSKPADAESIRKPFCRGVK